MFKAIKVDRAVCSKRRVYTHRFSPEPHIQMEHMVQPQTLRLQAAYVPVLYAYDLKYRL